jgi:hypothetical protein
MNARERLASGDGTVVLRGTLTRDVSGEFLEHSASDLIHG